MSQFAVLTHWSINGKVKCVITPRRNQHRTTPDEHWPHLKDENFMSVRISSLTRSHAFSKFSIILILLACSARVLAGCSADQSAGWEIFSLCEANFDGGGNYVNSSCHMGDPPGPGQTSMNMCLPAPSVGGCSGSACTWDGPLND